MGNQTSSRVYGEDGAAAAAFARRPTDKEMIILYHLQKKLFKRLVESPEHVGMLHRYWDLSIRNKQTAPPFERQSVFWHIDGGFSTSNPADDLRGMGELGLQCLLSFIESYPGEAAMMKRVRGGYPFVQAALAVARALCEVFRLVDEDSSVGKFPVTRTLYWQLLETDASFYELFALLFLLFDELFCEEAALQTQLQDERVCSLAVVSKLADAAKRQLLRALVRAPMRVDDLRGLCANALHALNRRQERRAVVAQLPAAMSLQSSSNTIVPVSRWKQHETHRKTMREVGHNWRAHVDSVGSAALAAPRRRCRTYASSHSAGECLYRLQPRSPEIAFSLPPSRYIGDSNIMASTLLSPSLPTVTEEPESSSDDDSSGGADNTEAIDNNDALTHSYKEEATEANLFHGLELSKVTVRASVVMAPLRASTAALVSSNGIDCRRHRAATAS